MYLAGRGNQFPQGGTAVETTQFEINADDNVKGAQNAVVTIVEFSDYQCPACKSYAPVLDEIINAFPNDVRLVYKHYPLRSIHPRADIAARAAEAAGAQGKFWEMTDLLFANQELWSRQAGTQAFEEYASTLGLNQAQFLSDLESDAAKNKVNNDVALGQSLMITGTPTFYVNGKRVTNPRSFEEFKLFIETEINTVKGQ